MLSTDVLCVGQASYDLVFAVARHPSADEKIVAEDFIACGGGPAANAAAMVAQLGGKAAFAGYLGSDLYGDKHVQEFVNIGVNTDFIVRGASPTPLSTVLVKPNGQRALINYKGDTHALPADAIDFSTVQAKVILFDGHEPQISVPLAKQARSKNIATVLDAGSVHDGTLALLAQVDYAVCSEKFALQYAGDENSALQQLATIAPVVVITLGERGLIWQRGNEYGVLPAITVNAVDTTGAGDAFHGAFAVALAFGMEWHDILRYASVAGTLCCTKMGARLGLPSLAEHSALFTQIKTK